MSETSPERVPDEWVRAAEGHYSMHGAGLIRNIIAGVAPLIAAAERERIVRLAQEHGASYWRKVMSGDDPPQEYVAEFPFEDLLRAEA